MGVNHKKIPVEKINVGMYVSALDRPWIDTDFLLEGFFIQDLHDVKKIQKLCEFVYIDIDLTMDQTRINIPKELISQQLSEPPLHQKKLSERQSGISKDIPISDMHYDQIISLSNDFLSANQLYKDINHTASELLADIKAQKKVDLSHVKHSATMVVDSVVRNPDALLWLTHLYEKDSHSHHRSLRTTIWAIAFASYLGVKKKQLNNLSTALFLCNIGKAMLSIELLEHEDTLNSEEKKLYENHVNLTLKALKIMGRTPQSVITIIRAHCERYDGSGYPMNLIGNEISFLAQVAGLVTYYEAIMNRRNPKKSFDALRAAEHLYSLRNTQFSAELVDEFIQSIGVYPIGSIVALNSYEIAMVIKQNKKHQLLPQLLILRDKNHNVIHDLQIKDLYTLNHETHSMKTKIIKMYPLGMFNINASEIITRLEQVG